MWERKELVVYLWGECRNINDILQGQLAVTALYLQIVAETSRCSGPCGPTTPHILDTLYIMSLKGSVMQTVRFMGFFENAHCSSNFIFVPGVSECSTDSFGDSAWRGEVLERAKDGTRPASVVAVCIPL
jgi:hypothetical protein